jgi:DNA-binding transcriptional LysR family regulator
VDVDLKLLRSFAVVAEEEHVGRAAARLILSQSALSKQIRKLEESVGTPLVRKAGRNIELTAAGRALAEAAPALLASIDAALDRVQAAGRAEQDRVVIAFVPPMPPSLTTDLMRTAPGSLDCEVVLHHAEWGDQVAVVTSRHADLALVRGPIDGFPDHEDLAWQPVFSEPRVAAFAASHRLAGASRVTMADLADEPIVATAPNTEFWTVDPRPDGRRPVLGPSVSSVDEMLELVAAGRAMVITARSQADYYSRPDISYVPVEGIAPSEVLVVWDPASITPAAGRVLGDLRRRAESDRA